MEIIASGLYLKTSEPGLQGKLEQSLDPKLGSNLVTLRPVSSQSIRNRIAIVRAHSLGGSLARIVPLKNRDSRAKGTRRFYENLGKRMLKSVIKEGSDGKKGSRCVKHEPGTDAVSSQKTRDTVRHVRSQTINLR